MKVYIIRHGQTDWNVQRKMQGVTDIELNETGMSQAEEARKKINELDIDLILSSPLKRAKKTAEILNKDKKLEIIYDESFIERNFGNYEGVVIKEKCKDIFNSQDLFNLNLDLTTNNIEPISKVLERVTKRFDEIKNEYEGKNILIVTHGGVSRAINAYFTGIPNDGIIMSANLGNCEIREFDL